MFSTAFFYKVVKTRDCVVNLSMTWFCYNHQVGQKTIKLSCEIYSFSYYICQPRSADNTEITLKDLIISIVTNLQFWAFVAYETKTVSIPLFQEGGWYFSAHSLKNHPYSKEGWGNFLHKQRRPNAKYFQILSIYH